MPPTKKKIEIYFLYKMYFFTFFLFQKCSNLHERSRIGWTERKTKFPIFAIFIFRIMVIFVIKIETIKNVLEKSCHIISYFWVIVSQKIQKDAQQIKFSSKVTKFSEKIRIDLIMIFTSIVFFVWLLVFEIQYILVMIVFTFYNCFYYVFWVIFSSEMMFISKDAQYSDRSFSNRQVFFLYDS